MLHGARQSGKSTLARQIAQEKNAPYVNLDFPDQRDAAIAEPVRFVSQSPSHLMVIDEVQRGGQDLLLAIKTRLDQDNRPGQFLLTGSANFLTLPTVSESLQGRIAVEMLHPFAQSELAEPHPDSFVDVAFSDAESLGAISMAPIGAEEYWELIATGGYPEVQSRSGTFLSGWFRQYVETAISREIIDLGNISDRSAVSGVLNHCAAVSSRELNLQALAKSSGLTRPTISQYLAWLESTHLITLIPAWRRSLSQRQIKSAKLLVSDSGLACHLAGKDAFGLSQSNDVYRGQALETFVGNELRRILGWSATRARIYHFRTVNGAEVDFVLESPDGRVVGVEVKATTSPGRNTGRGLKRLRDAIDRSGGEFVHGFVIHLGDRFAPLGDRVSAIPLQALWPQSLAMSRAVPRMDSGSQDAHRSTVANLVEQPVKPAIAISLNPRNRNSSLAFDHESRILADRFSQIIEISRPTGDQFGVQRAYLQYHVTGAVIEFGEPKLEYIAGELHLDGSCAWFFPIATEIPARGSTASFPVSLVTPVDFMLALVAGLQAATEWSAGLSGLEGAASVGVQLLPPKAGIALTGGSGGSILPAGSGSQGLRKVTDDLDPLVVDADISQWATDPASMMLAARFLGEHLLAAFGYEGPLPIDDQGRFAARHVDLRLRTGLALAVADFGIQCDWNDPRTSN